MSEAASATRQLEPEDQARANFYALLARLFREAPDVALLRAIAGAPPLAPSEPVSTTDDPASDLARAWDALRAASEDAVAEAVRDEYQALFIGVGRSEVSLYASHYLGPRSARPLAEIRASLAERGLARRPAESEFEDHLALVLETMRMLVAGDADRFPAEIAEQQSFFERHVVTWAQQCCNAIMDSSVANYYRYVAQFTSSFMAIEQASFAIA